MTAPGEKASDEVSAREARRLMRLTHEWLQARGIVLSNENSTALDRVICAAVNHLGTTLEAAFRHAADHGAAEALLAQAHGAAPQLRDRLPLVLWFDNPADRAQLVAAIEEAKPGMISRRFTP